MQTIFGWLILQRVEKKKMFARNGLFVFETKGEATSWIKWIGEFGDACVNVKINDPSTPAIDVYHLGETARKRAEAFVDVMKAGFGADDIQFASTGILVSLMTATFAFPVENIMPMLFNDLDPNPVMAAFILCGGLNDQSGLDLHSALVQWNATHPSEEQNRALTELGTIFGEKVTPSNRDSKTSAPRSKLAVLANNLGAFFATARPRFTMQYAVENHWITLIDYGSSASMGDLARSTITGMLFDHLRKTIENTCSSWQAEGRYSSIFIDEVAAIPTATREPSISWIRDQGRSYGVVPYLAAQSPAQLSPKLVGTLTSLGTFFALSQRDADAVRVITNALSLYGGWSAEEVASLPFYYAIMRSTFREQTQQAALVKLLLWDGTEAAAGRSPIDYREELTGD
jgi:hypothetical protein